MPSLHQLITAMRAHCRAAQCPVPDQVWESLATQLRTQFAAQRVYIPPIDSRKNPARAEAVRQAVRRLPTGVAAAFRSSM